MPQLHLHTTPQNRRCEPVLPATAAAIGTTMRLASLQHNTLSLHECLCQHGKGSYVVSTSSCCQHIRCSSAVSPALLPGLPPMSVLTHPPPAVPHRCQGPAHPFPHTPTHLLDFSVQLHVATAEADPDGGAVVLQVLAHRGATPPGGSIHQGSG